MWSTANSIFVPNIIWNPLWLYQAQHSHHVIQQVLNHLDTNNKNTPRVRAGIVQVLLETVAIAAKGSVGELKWRTASLCRTSWRKMSSSLWGLKNGVISFTTASLQMAITCQTQQQRAGRGTDRGGINVKKESETASPRIRIKYVHQSRMLLAFSLLLCSQKKVIIRCELAQFAHTGVWSSAVTGW